MVNNEKAPEDSGAADFLRQISADICYAYYVCKHSCCGYTGPGAVTFDLHRILLVPLCCNQNDIVAAFKVIERAVAVHLPEAYTCLSIVKCGDKTPASAFLCQFLPACLEFPVKFRNIFPELFETSLKIFVRDEEILLDITLFDCISG